MKTVTCSCSLVQEVHPEGERDVPRQRDGFLPGVPPLLLRAHHVVRERVRGRHHPQHAGAGEALFIFIIFIVTFFINTHSLVRWFSKRRKSLKLSNEMFFLIKF